MTNEPEFIVLAVNGTLMRGLELNKNLLATGARFYREAVTAPVYRLWSIEDRHPAMMQVAHSGASIHLELWLIPRSGIVEVLLNEPPGLCVGKVKLSDGSEVLGILGEPILCEGQEEITSYSGWRAYIEAKALDVAN